MKNIVSILFFTFLFGCFLQSDEEEVKAFVYEKAKIELPDGFKVITNQLHGDYQTDDSDFSRDVYLKFSGESLEELISIVKGKWEQDGSKYYFILDNGCKATMSLDTISGGFSISYFK